MFVFLNNYSSCMAVLPGNKCVFTFFVLDFAHWSVRDDYVPLRHQIFAPKTVVKFGLLEYGRTPAFPF